MLPGETPLPTIVISSKMGDYKGCSKGTAGGVLTYRSPFTALCQKPVYEACSAVPLYKAKKNRLTLNLNDEKSHLFFINYINVQESSQRQC
jgi:hypothetical protein